MDFKNDIIKTFNQTNGWILLLAIVMGLFFWNLIPPFQSPDEPDHIKAAYIIAQGFDFDTSKEVVHGGMIDSGLTEYIAVYSGLGHNSYSKLSAREIYLSKNIQWTGTKLYTLLPNGYYLPLVYLPQAIGLALGEGLGLSVDTSYRLTRVMSLLCIAAILLVTVKIYPVNPLTVALLIMPMTLFQIFSPTIDGILTALAILAIATFLRIAMEKENTRPWLFYTLIVSVFLVVTSKINLLPILLFILAACFYTKKRKNFYFFAATLFLVLSWLVIAVKTSVDTRVDLKLSSTDIAWFYISNPWTFFHVFINTFSNDTVVKDYYISFIGILGWLDTYFSDGFYAIQFTFVVLIGLLSISVKNLKANWLPRAILLFCSVISVLMVFFALLVTWTPHPATEVKGVQGRYFLIPMIMVAYAISGELKLYEGLARKIALGLLLILCGITIFFTPSLLIDRYYLPQEQYYGQIPTVSMDIAVPISCEGALDLVSQERKGWLIVLGWIVRSGQEMTVPDAIFVTLTNQHGEKIYYKPHRIPRPDVLEHFNQPKMPNPGYRLDIKVSALSGDYILGISQMNDGKLEACENFNTSLHIK